MNHARPPDSLSVSVSRASAHDEDDRYTAEWGAGDPEFDTAASAGKLAMLFALFVHLTTEEKIRPRELDQALKVVPEYRQLVSRE